jgi:hypothetical protein
MKLLILVLSVEDGGIYDEFYKSQNDTWNSEIVNNVETYYLYGGSNINEINDKKVFTGIEEFLFMNPGVYYKSPLSAGVKTIKGLEMLNDIIDYDFVLRTNLSSYIDKKMIYDYLLDKPRSKYYSGCVGIENRDIFGNIVKEITYASGSGFILSKDLVEFLIDHKNEIENNRFIDDAAIGKLLNEYEIYPESLHRVDLINTDFDMESIKDGYFYRMKSINRDFDIKNMYKIHKNKKNK